MARTPKPAAPPLAVTLRAALAQGWHTLDALEALAGRVPAARHRVHAALAELRAGGCALEERVTRGVAEVRLAPATLPAPVPDDHRTDLAATVTDLAREAQEVGLPLSDGWAEAIDSLGLSEEEAERLRPVWTSAQDAWRRERVEGEHPTLREPSPPVEGEPVDAASYYLGRGRGEEDDLDAPLPIAGMRRHAGKADAPAPPCEPSAPVGVADAPVEAPREHTDPLFVECRVCNADTGHPCKGVEGQVFDGSPHVMRAADAEAWASEQEGKPSATPFDHPPAPRSPGPSSRCADCGAAYKRHAESGAAKPAPGACAAFKALPRGRPPVERPCGGVVAAPPSPPLDAPAPTAADVLAEIGTPLSREHLDAVRAWASGGAAEPETSRGESEETSDHASEAEQVGPTDGGDGVEIPSPSHAHEVDGEPRVHDAATYQATAQGCADVGHHDAAGATESAASVAQRGVRRAVKARPESDHASEANRDRPTGGVGVGREAAPRAAVARKSRVPSAQADQVAPTNRAARSPGVDVARAPDAVVRCRPPLCHWDDIIEPARVRGFQRPLCEAHRARVEGAGGTVAPVD